MFLSKENEHECKEIFKKIIDKAVEKKISNKFMEKSFNMDQLTKLLEVPSEGQEINSLINYFAEDIVPYCSNFSSSKFMSFPDAGNSVAGLSGAIFADFLQQNLINSSFCAPIATYMEISVIHWLRKVVGYDSKEINNIWDVGGIITYGGTGSNTTAMMLARENHRLNTMKHGVESPKDYITIIPKGIGHYSIRSASMWLGLGDNIIEVETNNFKYNLEALRETIRQYKGRIMCVVAYVGDSRTMTIDNLEEIYNIVKQEDEHIWLHADACHGFSLGFSNKHKGKIKGIEKFDSISTDPHKVLDLPYCLSALLVKKPEMFKMITSTSDLIMQEDFAFGQITPFIGSKSWVSLKLWFVMKNLGINGIEKMIDNRLEMAQLLKMKIEQDENFVLVNNVDINSVVFMYAPKDIRCDVEKVNNINKKIHDIMAKEGLYHLHQFSLEDNRGVLKQGVILYPLRYMSGNPNINEQDLNSMLEYVKKIGVQVVNE
ncbi:MAG: pyridoxal phosphate-dependent decarboxylase family protein [Christensenellales bacterium]